MKYDARKISTEEQHLLRRLAVQRVFDGETAAAVTRDLGLGARTIFTWLKLAKKGGIDALTPKLRSGRNRMLSLSEEHQVKGWIIGNEPNQFGFDSKLWTRQTVLDLIKDKLSVTLSLTTTGELLHRLNLTPKKHTGETFKADKKSENKWNNTIYPKLKKYAKNKGAEIFWLNEVTILPDAPPPIIRNNKESKSTAKKDIQNTRTTTITALSNKGGFWYHVSQGKLNSNNFIECLKRLIDRQKNPTILIINGNPTHISQKTNNFIALTEGNIEIIFTSGEENETATKDSTYNHLINIDKLNKPLEKLTFFKNKEIKNKNSNKKIESLFKKTKIFPTDLNYINLSNPHPEYIVSLNKLNKLAKDKKNSSIYAATTSNLNELRK